MLEMERAIIRTTTKMQKKFARTHETIMTMRADRTGVKNNISTASTKTNLMAKKRKNGKGQQPRNNKTILPETTNYIVPHGWNVEHIICTTI